MGWPEQGLMSLLARPLPTRPTMVLYTPFATTQRLESSTACTIQVPKSPLALGGSFAPSRLSCPREPTCTSLGSQPTTSTFILLIIYVPLNLFFHVALPFWSWWKEDIRQ